MSWFRAAVSHPHLENCGWLMTSPSSRMGNFTSQLPTMFWILNSMNRACRHRDRQTLAAVTAYLSHSSWGEAGEVEGGGGVGGREGERGRGGGSLESRASE